jgi:hypothetical protein
MTEILRKAKEEPLFDERIPHPYREVVKELRAIKAQLEEISQKLPLAAPLVVVRPGGVPPKVPAIQLPKEEFMNVYVEALEKYDSLRLANDLHVETVDLGVDRSTSDKIEEFPKLKGIALTIFRATGSFDLYINEKDDYHKLDFDAISYPQTFLLGFRAKTFYIGNAAQTGKSVVLIAWKRV